MFGIQFYPTPLEVINTMLSHFDITNKVILEPSAGKGDIVKALKENGASEVLACEIDSNLFKIVGKECRMIGTDFMNITSEKISHIHAIFMNPPFQSGAEHLLHAYEIAPSNCTIICLLNSNTLKNRHSKQREQLKTIIDSLGRSIDLGEVFAEAERVTDCPISLVVIKKEANNYEQEFEGFFDTNEVEEDQYNGIMPYNFIRDLVNRYVSSVKCFDRQLETAKEMNTLCNGFFRSDISLQVSVDKVEITRNSFKKELQKSAWTHIFNKMNMDKYVTRGLKDDINKFVETQTHIPFTMKNIYKMLEIVVGTQSSRMDKAILEVFDKLTKHYDENRYNVEGWKTNSSYMINSTFILPWIAEAGYTGPQIRYDSQSQLDDLMKAMCYIMGDDFTTFKKIDEVFSSRNPERPEWGKWVDWHYFEVKLYKKRTGHFRFKEEYTWARVNQNICRILGNPIPEKITKVKVNSRWK